MLTLFVMAIAAHSDPDAARRAATCELGRVALRELPKDSDAPGRYDLRYGFPNPRSPDLLDACPELTRELQTDIPLADAEARRRASVHAPTQERTPLTKIFNIGLPQFSADLKTADVSMSYECTGLCAGGFVATYVRGPAGWRRTGIRNVWVS